MRSLFSALAGVAVSSVLVATSAYVVLRPLTPNEVVADEFSLFDGRVTSGSETFLYDPKVFENVTGGMSTLVADAPVGVVPENVILACTPDAYRLCFTSLLDRTSAEACMRRNWALVSVRCKLAVAGAGIRK